MSFDIDRDVIRSQAVIGCDLSGNDEESKEHFYNSLTNNNDIVTDYDPDRADFKYRIDARYDLHSTLMLKGAFGAADYLNSNIPKESGEETEVKGVNKYESEPNIIRASVIEKNQKSKKISFALTGKFDSEDGFLMVTVYEVVGKHRKLIFETLPITKSVPINDRPGLFYFEKIEINTDIFETEFTTSVLLEFELKRVKYSKKKKESFKVLGSET